MASKMNLYCFLKPSRFLPLLALTLALLFFAGCAADPVQLHRKVGENATFYCTDTQRPLKLMYLQIGEKFVNGFHSTDVITVSTWPNTAVDDKAAAVHMYDLNVSDGGDYQCYFQFEDSAQILTRLISLRVTAPYSRPSIWSRCDAENLSCVVECSSHGGYPSAELAWNATESNGSQWRGSVNNSEVSNPDTSLFNISSSAVFNCSSGERKVSCSVNDSTSDILSSVIVSVCSAPHEPYSWISIIATVVCILIFIPAMVICYCCCCKKKSTSRTSPENSMSTVEELKSLKVTSPAS